MLVKSLWIIVKTVILILLTAILIIFTGDTELLYLLIAIICCYIILEVIDPRKKHKVGTDKEIIDSMLNDNIGVDEARKKEGREMFDFSEIVLNKYLGERNEKN